MSAAAARDGNCADLHVCVRNCQTLAWSWLLDVVRYLMSWHPVVIFFLQFLLWEAGLSLKPVEEPTGLAPPTA